MPFRKNRCNGRAANEFLNIVSPRGREAGHFRPARCLCHRAGYIENLQEAGEASCPGIFFFFTFFFSIFPLFTSRLGVMRIQAMGKKSEKKNKVCVDTRGIVLCPGLASVRAKYIFFSLCFPASFFTRGKDAY